LIHVDLSSSNIMNLNPPTVMDSHATTSMDLFLAPENRHPHTGGGAVTPPSEMGQHRFGGKTCHGSQKSGHSSTERTRQA